MSEINIVLIKYLSKIIFLNKISFQINLFMSLEKIAPIDSLSIGYKILFMSI